MSNLQALEVGMRYSSKRNNSVSLSYVCQETYVSVGCPFIQSKIILVSYERYSGFHFCSIFQTSLFARSSVSAQP